MEWVSIGVEDVVVEDAVFVGALSDDHFHLIQVTLLLAGLTR